MLHRCQAVIFDMDGVIIDSEPLWREAMKKGFNELGIEFTEEDCISTTGMRLKEVVAFWKKQYPNEIENPEKLYNTIIQNLISLINVKGEAQPGLHSLLKMLVRCNIKTGLATSSDELLANTVLDKLNLRNSFQQVVSAEKLNWGKPHPEVYLTCANKLQIEPANCIAIEDSINGIVSAKAAQMFVIGIPDVSQRFNPKFQIADLVINHLDEALEFIRQKNTFLFQS